ncbi:AI-2E family transporter [Proteiniphilum sp.]|uniref:AI-2E family transporter n=1 Tax=Proteiniphilum sp. TaxID=1926877 RepID=UPI0033209F0D
MPNGKSRYHRVVLVGLILFLTVVIFKELQPYLGGFFGAFTLFILLKGVMVKLVEKYHWKKGLSASVIVLGTTLFILIPLTGFGFLVADTISGISIDPAQIMRTMREFSDSVEERFGFTLFTPENLAFVPRAGSSIMQTLVSGVSSMVINGIIAIFLLYFMLVSYTSLEEATIEILPFSQENKHILSEETKSIIQANAIGIPVVAITQGILAYIGYLSFGVSNPLVYAVLVACTTIIPVVGTGLVWVPIGISALAQGDIMRGILLLGYGLLIIGGSDAILRFVLQKRLANIHPLITFFGVIMGLAMFGFWGIIFGPLLISLLLLFLNMYRHDFIPGSTAQPHITTKEGGKAGILFRKKQAK